MYTINKEVKYQRGDLVYHIADTEKTPYVVTGYLIEDNNIRYQCNGQDVGYFYEFELEGAKEVKSKKVEGFTKKN